MKNRLYYLCALVLPLLVVVAVLVCVAESYVERSQAKGLLAVISNIQVGITQQREVESLTKKYSSYNARNLFPDEPKSGEYDEFTFRNRGYGFLRIGCIKVVWMDIYYKDGVVASKSIHLAAKPNHGMSLVERTHLIEDGSDENKSAGIGRRITERGSLSEATYMLGIEDDLSAPVARRKLDWNIDLSCMTKLKGCDNPHEVFRGAFQ
jgi:hypothetical protein